MKRFMLFMGATYYPGGGWDDFAGWFDTYKEAVDHFKEKQTAEWFHVIDTNTGEPYSE